MYVDDKTLKDLEWSTILKHLANHATSELGKELCRNLLPAADEEDVKESLTKTTEARKMHQMALDPPFGGIYDLRQILRNAEIGLSLEIKDFIDIGSTLSASKAVKEFFEKNKELCPNLFEIADLLLEQDRLINDIYRCFDPNGNMLNTASPRLKQLRDSFRDQTNNLKDKLNSLLSSKTIAGYLQEPVYTIRNDRYVLPVKNEHKSDVPGIVHDSSASGVTFYIEPRSIVDLNNKLKETELQIEHEIQRILAELTRHVAQNSERIVINLNFLAELDLIFAKAKYSSLLDAGEPEVNTDKIIDLKLVRHPILIRTIKNVVPNSVKICDEHKNLIITGANTGGKTVLLKTIGLCVLMAGAGMHIPADTGSSVHLFSSVFSDIGEEQSLEHSLSTFSAKMTNIINIVNNADNNSLVLLDELGAGTDPAEGTSLAQAILEALDAKGASTVVTTHYGGLKTLAFSHKGFYNASVEFDFDTLKPTFRLLMGVPGQSNATTIARNLGLSVEIVSRAEDIYSATADDFSLMLEKLQRMQREITKEHDQAREKHEKAQELKENYEELIEKLNSSKDQSVNTFRRNLNTELNKAKSEVIAILDQLKKDKTEKSAKRAHSKLSELGHNVQKKAESFRKGRKNRKKTTPVDWHTVSIGDRVYIKKLEQEGELISLPDNQNRVVVQMGLVKTTLKTEDVALLEKSKPDEYYPRFQSPAPRATKVHRDDLSMNLDLRGKRVDDALADIDIFLDKAAMANLAAVYIIHGHGTGALKKAVRDYLKDSPYVLDFRPGEQSEGGDGVSIVELK